MTEPKHKFDETIESITYREYLMGIYRPLVNFIRNLEETLGKERTHEIVAEYNIQRCIANQKKRMKSLDEPIESIDDVKAWFKKSSENKANQMMQSKKDVESAHGSYCFDVTECLWATVFRELDAEDLGLIIECDTDFAFATAMHENLKLERTETLMQGDSCCDFSFQWNELTDK